jgi:class 3 adenylate cyclase
LRLGLKLVAANGSMAVAVPPGRTLVVGRSPACDVPIRDLTVSRHHGEIEAAAGGLRIRDLGSTNGTFVNGARISEGMAAPGARVSFGKVVFQVVEERTTETSYPQVGTDRQGGGGEAGGERRLTVVSQMRAQGSADLGRFLTPDPPESGGSMLRVRGATTVERRAAAQSLLVEIAKELSQQGEPARLLDKAARLVLQVMGVAGVEILTLGEEDEMVPRVSKIRPGSATGSARLPEPVARKAMAEKVAVLAAETLPGAAAPQAVGEQPAAPDPLVGEQPAAPDPLAGVQPAAPDRSVGEQPAAPDPLASEQPAAPEPLAGGQSGEPAAAHLVVPAATTDAVVVTPESGQHRLASAASLRGSAICAPLIGMQATVVGLLSVRAAETGALGREDLEFLASLAGIVAVNLENLLLMERARAEAVAQAGYQRQFGPLIAEQVTGHDGAASLGGARRRVAFLHCEIVGFTALAEELEIEEVGRLLGELFSELIDLVFEHGGTLDRRTGTGLTALWGAPLGRQDDADQAVEAAVGMMRGLERLNGEWTRQHRHALAMAIGIDLGQVFAGNVGSERRLDFTAIGRPVERAAQLCAAAGAGEILVTEALLEALSSPPPVDAMPAVAAAAARPAGRAMAEAPAGGEPAASGPVYRIDWRTPPTLRQSGQVQQV